MRDFAPVTQLATGPAVLVVHPSLPVKSINEPVKLAPARPGAIDCASGGAGTFFALPCQPAATHSATGRGAIMFADPTAGGGRVM